MKLSCTFRWALLSAALILASACKRSETPRPPAAAPAASPATALATPEAGVAGGGDPPAPEELKGPDEPTVDWKSVLAPLGLPSLVVLQPTDEHCEWSVLRPPQLEARVFLITHVCPTRLVWDRRGGRSLFSVEGTLYLHDWEKGKVEELVAPPLGEPNFGFSTASAILACEDSIQPDGGGSTVGYRLTLQRQDDGVWRKIAFENTGYHSRTPDCTAFSDEGFGLLSYVPRFQPSTACNNEQQLGNPNCPSKALVEQVSARVQREHDAVEFLGFSARSFIAFPVQYGMYDPTKLAPLFSIENDTVTQLEDRPSELEGREVLLGVDHFLVRNFEMSHATLFEKGKVEPAKVFPDIARVFWIPGTIAPADVIELIPEGSGDED